MNPYDDFLNDLINQNTKEYADYNGQIKWINYYSGLEYENIREEILKNIENLNWSFQHTKPWINSLSKGCELCGEGEWSCLFITNKCNASCFFCPAQQLNDESPATQSFIFENPKDYVSYLKAFNFKGVSLSGGEPLLFFDKTLNYLKEIDKEFGKSIYKWVYTNGILGKKEHFENLNDVGVDEVRFDLAASGYNVELLKNAQSFIKNVTVEIPAIPEDFEKLTKILPALIKLNVTNLNLHQLRLTSFNASKLLKRNYTFLHGERVTVIESELTALKIMKYVSQKGLPIGINYCGFSFKNRFQKAGFRIKVATLLKKEGEEITSVGYLRSIELRAYKSQIVFNKIVYLKYLKDNRKFIDEIVIHYRDVKLSEAIIYDNDENIYFIGNKAYKKTEYKVSKPLILKNEMIDEFLNIVDSQDNRIPEDDLYFQIWQFERIESGLRSYF